MTAPEFERRYEALPDVKKAELINGVVLMPSPVRLRRHATPHAGLMFWLTHHWAYTPGLIVGDNGTMRLDLLNMPQPDSFMLIDPVLGGQARISTDDYVESGPEWVGEIAASSVSYDLGSKLQVYRQHHIREYLVWRVLDNALDWFLLRDEQYQTMIPGSDGILRSTVFPGLWLDVAALLRLDLVKVQQVLDQGLASPDHAAFVARLQAAQSNQPR